MNRRTLLSGALGTLGMSQLAWAQSAPGKRFLFVHATGGWDPLNVFAPLFGSGSVQFDAGSEPMTIGGLSLVDGPGRPAVRSFFEAYHQRAVLFHGVSVRSVNHGTCATVALTGATSDERADWATLIARDEASAFDLPHVVVSGTVFPGPYGVLVSRAEGALGDLVSGDLLGDSEPPVSGLDRVAGRQVDAFLEQRVAAFGAAHPGHPHAADLAESWRRTRRLLDTSESFELRSGFTLSARLETAISALSTGLARTATVGTDFIWDSHVDNSEQAGLFQGLFTDLTRAMELLATTPSPGGGVLADDTVLVVLSEMGRTPVFNGTGGRDHWPFTTMMALGPGLIGDRVVGGYTDGYLGIGADPTTGELDPARAGISAEEIGATLLELAGIDPGESLPGVSAIRGVLG